MKKFKMQQLKCCRAGFVKDPFFLVVGIFMLLFPLFAGYMIFSRVLVEKGLRANGVETVATIDSLAVETETDNSANSANSRRSGSRGDAHLKTEVRKVYYHYQDQAGVTHKGAQPIHDREFFKSLEKGGKIKVFYDPEKPVISIPENTLEPHAGLLMFRVVAAVLLCGFCLPGLFLIYVSTKSAKSAKTSTSNLSD